MDIKTINARKEELQKRIIADVAMVAVGMVFVVAVVFVAGGSDIFQQITGGFEERNSFGLLIIITILAMASWVFSLRRYMDIREAMKEFNSVEEIKDNIVSNLRHELKTPLVPIAGYSQLLYDENLGEINTRQKDALKRIVISSEKLERLIDSLIFISAAKYGELEYTFTTLRIEDLITGAIAELSEPLNQKEQAFETNLQAGLPFIEGDKKYLKEALVQIMENAIKFSPQGEKITIVTHEGYKSVHIKITDNGIGIPEEELENIFLRFYQTDGSKSRRYGGNGLGLHIARTIAEAHKGNIWIESIPEKGTTVHISLPCSHQVRKNN